MNHQPCKDGIIITPLQGWGSCLHRSQGFTLGYHIPTPAGFSAENHFLVFYHIHADSRSLTPDHNLLPRERQVQLGSRKQESVTSSNLMKILVLLLLVTLAAPLFAQPKLPDKFALTPNPIELTRAARPREYIEAVGRKAALFGHETGVFEAWAFPMKLLHDARLSILVEGQDSPVEFGDNIERIITRPEATTLIASNQLFTLRAHFLTPIDEAGSLVLLDVDTARPLTITVSFVPDMKPMWPGGLGGQSAGWRDDLKAFVISESRRKFNAFFGSPAATKGIATPAHQLASGALRFDLKIDPQQAKKSFYPLIIAASTKDRQTAIDLYHKLSNTIPAQYQKTFAHYRRLRDEMLSIETPDEKLNLAFEWAKVSLDKGMVDNPDLGLGLVAGWNATGNGARPGFGWFFGGDAAMNSYAMTAYGDWENVKATFRFLAKYQRADGKIPHEVSQAAGMIKWFEEYPYAYYHADTTPFYIAAVHNYYQQSGDQAFIRELWPMLTKAYQFCVDNDTDGDGILENSKAGLGASELGSLLNDLHQDIYLAATNAQASMAMIDLAENRASSKLAFDRWILATEAIKTRYWNQEQQRYAYALTKDAQQNLKQNLETTAWAALPLFFLQVDKADKNLAQLASSELSTDWGTRMLSRQSKAYDPMAYNNGGVWPFLTGFVATGEYNYGRPHSGFAHLKQVANLTFDFALGYHPEILSGDYYRPLDESVPHQLFSSGMAITPLVVGMLGFHSMITDGEDPRIIFAPQLPATWQRVIVQRLKVLNDSLTFSSERKSVSSWQYAITRQQDTKASLALTIPLPYLAQAVQVRVDKQPVLCERRQPNTCNLKFRLAKHHVIEVTVSGGVEIDVPVTTPQIGDAVTSLKVLEVSPFGNNKLSLQVEGRSGQTYELRVRASQPFASLTGANLKGEKGGWKIIEISMPAEGNSDWQTKLIELIF